MNRSPNHPSLRADSSSALGEVAAGESALLYRDVCDAYSDLEHAFESHDPAATSEAARIWWAALQRLRAAS